MARIEFPNGIDVKLSNDTVQHFEMDDVGIQKAMLTKMLPHAVAFSNGESFDIDLVYPLTVHIFWEDTTHGSEEIMDVIEINNIDDFRQNVQKFLLLAIKRLDVNVEGYDENTFMKNMLAAE